MKTKIVNKISNQIIKVVKKKYGKKKNYPLHEPKFFKETIKDVNKTIKSTWVSSKGLEVKNFEKQINLLIKSNYTIATNSGTSAMHLAFLASKISSKDEILMPSLNFIANANVALYCGATPVFIDCNLNNLGVSPEHIENFLKNKCKKKGKYYVNKKTKKNIKAIVAVHVFGNACDILKIKKICKKYNLILIEDAAECIGSYYDDRHLGTYGDFGILSFNGNKAVTTGLGGAIIVKKKSNFKLINDLLNLNKSSSLDEEYNDIGYNYRMSALNASLGISQIKKLKYILDKKRKNFYYYKKNLDYSDYFFVKDTGNISKSNNWLIFLELKKNFIKLKKDILKELNRKKVYCRSIWKPLHTLDHLKKYQKENLKNTNEIFKKIICLPSSIN